MVSGEQVTAHVRINWIQLTGAITCVATVVVAHADVFPPQYKGYIELAAAIIGALNLYLIKPTSQG